MGIIFVSDNIILEGCLQFGDFDKQIVPFFLRMVQSNFHTWLGGEPACERFCLISYQDNYPSIFKKDGLHFIRLHTYGNYWCKWVYQFSHEYCHHLIDGECNGHIAGLKWFEETLCELSSMHNLNEMARVCAMSPMQNLTRFAPAVLDYLDGLLSVRQTTPQCTCREFLLQQKGKLAQPVYHRDVYSGIAASMFPLFVKNPCLWRIILHIGDSCRWSSLESLFSHVENVADASCRSSLLELRDLLLGSSRAPIEG